MTDTISLIYNVVALFGVVIIIYVMQAVEKDRIGKLDPPIVMQLRRLAFTGTALALCYSVISDEWHRSLPVLLLVSAGVLNLTVNAVSLHLRSPPGPGSRARNHSASYFMTRLVRYFHIHR